MSQLCRTVQHAYRSKNLPRLNTHRQLSISEKDMKKYPLRYTFSKIRRTWPFHVVVLQRTAKKCTNEEVENSELSRTCPISERKAFKCNGSQRNTKRGSHQTSKMKHLENKYPNLKNEKLRAGLLEV